jgi:hypothetical protein
MKLNNSCKLFKARVKITASSLRIISVLCSVEESRSVVHLISYDDGRRMLKNVKEKLFSIKHKHVKYVALMILNKYFNKNFCDKLRCLLRSAMHFYDKNKRCSKKVRYHLTLK